MPAAIGSPACPLTDQNGRHRTVSRDHRAACARLPHHVGRDALGNCLLLRRAAEAEGHATVTHRNHAVGPAEQRAEHAKRCPALADASARVGAQVTLSHLRLVSLAHGPLPSLEVVGAACRRPPFETFAEIEGIAKKIWKRIAKEIVKKSAN